MSPAAGSQEPAPGSNGGAPSILVVDDDPASRFLVGALLERGGFSVSEHDGGASALEALGRSSDFSLMVLDLDMPDMGGREVLAAVRSRAETATLPVIILTASLDEGADIELIEAGADDYLQKPVDPHRLLTRVKATLRRQTWDTVNIG
jgi:putative two-component system response regulator